MIVVYMNAAGQETLSRGVEEWLVNYVRQYGHITCLENWALERELTPWYVQACAHAAARKGLLRMTRLENRPGQPYKVTLAQGGEI
jgi:hypothetical protein